MDDFGSSAPDQLYLPCRVIGSQRQPAFQPYKPPYGVAGKAVQTSNETKEESVAQMSRRAAIALALAASLGTAYAAKHHAPPAPPADPLDGIDTDNDGTVSLDEANLAASARFDSLDTSLDGKIDHDEMKGHISPADFREADTSKDKYLNKDEYMALVVKRFKAADADKDGTIDVQEFNTRAGRALLVLLK